jgi:hypothetical protein
MGVPFILDFLARLALFLSGLRRFVNHRNLSAAQNCIMAEVATKQGQKQRLQSGSHASCGPKYRPTSAWIGRSHQQTRA